MATKLLRLVNDKKKTGGDIDLHLGAGGRSHILTLNRGCQWGLLISQLWPKDLTISKFLGLILLKSGMRGASD